MIVVIALIRIGRMRDSPAVINARHGGIALSENIRVVDQNDTVIYHHTQQDEESHQCIRVQKLFPVMINASNEPMAPVGWKRA
jgi:hypothetical protein